MLHGTTMLLKERKEQKSLRFSAIITGASMEPAHGAWPEAAAWSHDHMP